MMLKSKTSDIKQKHLLAR